MTYFLQAVFSYWIPQQSVPGRIGLLCTNYLSLTNMGLSGKQSGLQVFTAMDAWIFACKMFVFAAAFEYGAILMLRKAWIGSVKETLFQRRFNHIN